MFELNQQFYNPNEETIKAQREHFNHFNYIQCSNFFSASTLKLVQEKVAQVNEFRPFEHKELEESCEDIFGNLPFYMGLELKINDQKLFRYVEQITGCPTITCFSGRIYKFMPKAKHHLSWHSDLLGGRLVAMSINLSLKPYKGGDLLMKKCDSDEAPLRISNSNPGSAILFRIDKGLRHCVTDVEGENPRIALAGWFQNEPKSYFEFLNKSHPTSVYE